MNIAKRKKHLNKNCRHYESSAATKQASRCITVDTGDKGEWWAPFVNRNSFCSKHTSAALLFSPRFVLLVTQ